MTQQKKWNQIQKKNDAGTNISIGLHSKSDAKRTNEKKANENKLMHNHRFCPTRIQAKSLQCFLWAALSFSVGLMISCSTSASFAICSFHRVDDERARISTFLFLFAFFWASIFLRFFALQFFFRFFVRFHCNRCNVATITVWLTWYFSMFLVYVNFVPFSESDNINLRNLIESIAHLLLFLLLLVFSTFRNLALQFLWLLSHSIFRVMWPLRDVVNRRSIGVERISRSDILINFDFVISFRQTLLQLHSVCC